jgi:hypothetical protein
MSTTFIGTTFPKSFQWHQDEVDLIHSIQRQIESQFTNTQNLFINTTWFGPQFDNGQYTEFQKLVSQNQKFDNVFLLAAADPVFLNSDQIAQLAVDCGAQHTFLLGHLDTPYNFNFHSRVISKYFKTYQPEELMLDHPQWLYLNYNRKPRDHRAQLVEKLFEHDLQHLGIITLGKDHQIYNKSNIVPRELNLNELPNEGNWGMSMEFGIPHDIHTLGNMDLWQQHFLTVVSETEFLPWDNTFVSEKTWKPIIGMRPFIINGQTKIYAWLRTHGFRTFNHFWPHIEMENLTEFEVHDSMVAVIKYLATLDTTDIVQMYQRMHDDLVHNRNRFFEFAQEQKFKINHLFV